MDKQLVILSAPKGSVLEATEEVDGSSVLTMTSAKGDIEVFIVDPVKEKVTKYEG